MYKFNNETGELVINEVDLHNVIVGLRYIISELHVLDKVTIVPTNPDKFNKELVDKWERKFDDLFIMMGKMDAEYHDDAEYTC